jgi:hypothetical protein
MKIYGFVYSTSSTQNLAYFPSLGQFGVLPSGLYSKFEILEFDKTSEGIQNPIKIKNIEIEYGEIIEILNESYKIQSKNEIIYSLPIFFLFQLLT